MKGEEDKGRRHRAQARTDQIGGIEEPRSAARILPEVETAQHRKVAPMRVVAGEGKRRSGQNVPGRREAASSP